MRVLKLVFVIAAAMLCACSQKLDETKAAVLLKRSPHLSQPVVWTLEEERVCVSENRIFGNANTREVPQVARALESAGLVSVRRLDASDRNCLAFFEAYYHDIKLTEKGRAASKNWQRNGKSYSITVATLRSVEVSGLIRQDEATMQADYVVEYEPTESGKMLRVQLNRPGRARFRLSNKGWQLVDDGTNPYVSQLR